MTVFERRPPSLLAVPLAHCAACRQFRIFFFPSASPIADRAAPVSRACGVRGRAVRAWRRGGAPRPPRVPRAANSNSDDSKFLRSAKSHAHYTHTSSERPMSRPDETKPGKPQDTRRRRAGKRRRSRHFRRGFRLLPRRQRPDLPHSKLCGARAQHLSRRLRSLQCRMQPTLLPKPRLAFVTRDARGPP